MKTKKTTKEKFLIFLLSIVAIGLFVLIVRAVFDRLPLANPSGEKPKAGVGISEAELQERVATIVASKDASRCNDVPNNIYRTVCGNNIAENNALEKGDITYCKKLDNSLRLISDCEFNVLSRKSVQEGKESSCSASENEEVIKKCFDFYYATIASRELEVSLCDKISQSEQQKECINAVLLEKMGKSEAVDCSEFANIEAKSDCQYIKGQPRTEGSCEKLQSSVFRNKCYQAQNAL